MDLGRHLRYFLVVAREGHFGDAAAELGIAQPALSQSVRRLEAELGVALFDRSRRRVRLTPAGRLLVDQAREVVAGQARLRETMRRVRDGEVGSLRVGVPPGTSALALRGLLDGMAGEAPEVTVDVGAMTGAEVVRALGQGSVDTGLVTAPFDGSGLVGEPVHRVEVGVAVPRGAPLARAAGWSWRTWRGRSWWWPRARSSGVVRAGPGGVPRARVGAAEGARGRGLGVPVGAGAGGPGGGAGAGGPGGAGAAAGVASPGGGAVAPAHGGGAARAGRAPGGAGVRAGGGAGAGRARRRRRCRGRSAASRACVRGRWSTGAVRSPSG
nr:LysR family transcriptional regulator [Nocardiopsis sp. CNR-923]